MNPVALMAGSMPGEDGSLAPSNVSSDSRASGAVEIYLSEMSISDRHGGGITLQRVLGQDLTRISHFVHLSEFAQRMPPASAFADKSRFFLSPFETPLSRKLIGCTASARLFESEPARAWHARRAAVKISKLVPDGCIRALVCPQSRSSLQVIEALKEHRTIKYITWLMDDHLVQYRNGIWQYSSRAKDELRSHLRDASTVFVISPALGEFYRATFAVDSEVLFGPADPRPPLFDRPSGAGALKLAYFGRVWAWQVEAIIAFANAMRVSGEDALHVYAPEEASLERLRSFSNIVIEHPIASDLVVSEMRRYDAVLIPIGFADELRYLTDFNIATKMSECIGSGTITVVYGPERAAMVKFLRDTGSAVIVSEPKITDWHSLAERIRNPQHRRPVLDAAAALTKEQLSPDVMHDRWQRAAGRLAGSKQSN